MLRSFFRKRQCVPLVIPVEDEEKLQNIRDIPCDELRPKFLLQLGALRESLYAQLQPKHFRGTTATGASFAAIIQKFVSAINSGGVPQIGSVWDEAVKSQGKKALARGRDEFKVALRSIKQTLPLEETELEARFSAACTTTAEEFDRISSTQSQITRRYRSELVTESQSCRDELFEMNKTRSTTACTTLLNTLFRGVRTAVVGEAMEATKETAEGSEPAAASENSGKQMQFVWRQFEALRVKYLAESKGPSKLLVLDSIVASRMKDVCTNIYDQAIGSCLRLHGDLVTEKEKNSSLQSHVQELSANHLRSQEALLESEGLLGKLRAEMSSTEIEAQRKTHEMDQKVRLNEELSNTVSELEVKLSQQSVSLSRLKAEHAEIQTKSESSVKMLEEKLEQALEVNKEHVHRATTTEAAHKEAAAASSAKEVSLMQQHEAMEVLVQQTEEDRNSTRSALERYRMRCQELQDLVHAGLSELRSSNAANSKHVKGLAASQHAIMESAETEMAAALTMQQEKFIQQMTMQSRESTLLRGELRAAKESVERLSEDAVIQHGRHEAAALEQTEQLNLLHSEARAHTERFEELAASHKQLQDSHAASVAAKDAVLQRLAVTTKQEQSMAAELLRSQCKSQELVRFASFSFYCLTGYAQMNLFAYALPLCRSRTTTLYNNNCAGNVCMSLNRKHRLQTVRVIMQSRW